IISRGRGSGTNAKQEPSTPLCVSRNPCSQGLTWCWLGSKS
ncbi:hypothetical protein PC118_g25904, partial [Phytophthora cactorum]